MGIPVVGCQCPVCTSDNPHNKRLRPSGLLEIENKSVVIDCGPDFRQQALQAKITRLDGVIYTHAHYDHTGGIDDLRPLFMFNKKSIPCLLSKDSEADIRRRFDYVFFTDQNKLVPKMTLQILDADRGEVDFLGIKIQYMTYEQMGMLVNGIRVENFAYISDIRHYPQTIFQDLEGVDTLVLSALRFTPSSFHFSVDEAIEFANKIGAKHTWLTHISHEMEHEKGNAYLPSNVRLAYDGLQIQLD